MCLCVLEIQTCVWVCEAERVCVVDLCVDVYLVGVCPVLWCKADLLRPNPQGPKACQASWSSTLAGWLAGCLLAGWLAGRLLAGWLAGRWLIFLLIKSVIPFPPSVRLSSLRSLPNI